jgi:hypothetical protein
MATAQVPLQAGTIGLKRINIRIGGTHYDHAIGGKHLRSAIGVQTRQNPLTIFDRSGCEVLYAPLLPAATKLVTLFNS